METLKIDHPLGCGALYQFRDHKRLGLPFGLGLTDHELRCLDVRMVVPARVANFLPTSDSEIKLIFKSGYNSYLLLNKFIQKKCVIAFEGHRTLWEVKEITYLKYNPYREIIVKYLGLVVDKLD